MKKYLIALAFSIILAGAAFGANVTFPFIGKVNTNIANVRSGANVNFEILGKLKKGQKVVVLGKTQTWLKIKLPEDMPVFINSQFVQVRLESSGTISANRVNVRAKPDIKSNILTQLNKGDIVNILSKKDDWLKIKPTSACAGWISEELVDYVKNYSEEEERQALERPAPRVEPKETLPLQKIDGQLPIAKGIIEDSGILLAKRALHKLVDEKGQLLYYLDADRKLLDSFSTFKVAIWGEVVKLKAYDKPIIKVGKIMTIE